MITTRHARPSDIPWLLTQLRAFDAASPFRVSLFPDAAYAEASLQHLLDEHLVLVAVADAQTTTPTLVGFIAGYLAPHVFNPALLVCTELFWWVPPEHRGSRAGALLLLAFEAIAKARGCRWITMVLETTSPVDPRSLTRRGYVPKETTYVMEV